MSIWPVFDSVTLPYCILPHPSDKALHQRCISEGTQICWNLKVWPQVWVLCLKTHFALSSDFQRLCSYSWSMRSLKAQVVTTGSVWKAICSQSNLWIQIWIDLIQISPIVVLKRLCWQNIFWESAHISSCRLLKNMVPLAVASKRALCVWQRGLKGRPHCVKIKCF